MAGSLKWRALARIVCAGAVALSIIAGSAAPANALHAHGPYPTSTTDPSTCGTKGRLYYFITSNITTLTGGTRTPVWLADQQWAIQGLDKTMRLWNDDTYNYICSANIYIDAASNPGGPGGVTDTRDPYDACPYETWSNPGVGNQCSITMNSSPTSTWYFGTGTPPSGYYSFQGIVAHEMGHWLGVDHSDVMHNCDSTYTSSGCGFFPIQEVSNYYSVMESTGTSASTVQTFIKCDDISALNSARYGYYQNLAANPSFEYPGAGGGPGFCWHFKPSNTNAGSASTYCGGAQSYSCWVQFNGGYGAGASLQQDLYLDGTQRSFPHVRFWLRNGDTAGRWVPSVISLWFLSLGTNANVSFTVPPDGTWHYYSLDNVTVPSGTYRIRMELYNNSSCCNLDVDSAMLGSL